MRVLLCLWQKWAIHCWCGHRGRRYDREIWFSSQENVKWQNSIIKTLPSNVMYIHFCWWIFALMSKQAQLKMCFYYLCHSVSCAWPMLTLSQLFRCQQRSIDAADYLTPLYKQLKKNLLHRNESGPCEGNPSCHEVQVVKGSETSVIQQKSSAHSLRCNFFVLPFNNIHCGVFVVIKMCLVLFIFIRMFQSTVALYASAALMLPSFM